ncbi:MAG: noncanonical pyrimidine nucleotidase, YjjG family [Flavobacteriaceae bacterium]|nr:MAG: noncanonical pyrimidine nucleotidase, YjjG family [Flavobacteriaceae bacterium]
MKNNSIKHAFFDLDNTLWDFRKNSKFALEQMYLQNDIGQRFGVEFEIFESTYQQRNEALWADLRDQKVTKEELRARRFPEAFVILGIEDIALAQKFEAEYFDQIVKFDYLVEGTKELLDYLKPKYKIHVLTNGFLEVSRRKIYQSDLHPYLDSWCSAEEAGGRKPSPEVFAYALEKAGAKKQESVYIGDDWIADALGAHHFGLTSFFFNIDNLKVELPENVFEIKKLLEIKRWL